jgi:hypothetical protein
MFLGGRDGRHVGTPGGAALLCAVTGVVFALALGLTVWRMVLRERIRPRPGHPTRAFPFPPRFGLALPAFFAWLFVLILASAFALAGVEPGVIVGVSVSAALVGPFAAFGWLHVRRRAEYRRALASGELDGWREAVMKAQSSHRSGFWGTLVMTSLVSLFVFVPLGVVVVASFGVWSREVEQGLVALAVVLPVPVAAGAWLVPRARNKAERKRELEGASSGD